MKKSEMLRDAAVKVLQFRRSDGGVRQGLCMSTSVITCLVLTARQVVQKLPRWQQLSPGFIATFSLALGRIKVTWDT